MMEHKWSIAGPVCAAMCAAVLFGATGEALADDSHLFEVSVTNLTARQTFTPILVASHTAGVTLFTLGQPASVPLEVLAEAGDTGPLAAMLAAMPEVLEVTSSGAALPPGHSVAVTVRTQGEFDHVSVAAMLIPTNDGFFALNDVPGPINGVAPFDSPAYDAGTEADDELCAHIPGPAAICQGEGFNPNRAGDVNFVHIHRGIHGVGDLSAPEFDWRNPVAQVTIHRVR